MPPPMTTDDFLELAAKSGVLERKTATDFLQDHPEGQPQTPKDLAALLVREGLLTRFQADHLLAGKWRGFVISGKYRLLQRVGAGGMGCVYLCEHILMRRRVALKVLPVAQAEDPAALDRFYREARAVAVLDHPNIVRAHDIDHEGKLHFLVLEYVDGVSLQDLVKSRGPLSVVRACHYIRQAAYGLQHAHEAGLVHRDIKPGNLLVDRAGMVKLLDMGLARFFHDDRDELTKQYDATSVLGTADYLAPEQAVNSHDVDIRADIYSLGITFYCLLCGQTPFQDGTVAQKLIWHQVRQPKPIRSLRAEVPEPLAEVIDRMIAKDAAQRYQTPAEVADALEPWTCEPIPPPTADELPSSAAGGPASNVPRSSPVARGPLSPMPSKAEPADSGKATGRPRLEVATTRTPARAALDAAGAPTAKLPMQSSVDTPPIAAQRTVVPGTVPAVPVRAVEKKSAAKPSTPRQAHAKSQAKKISKKTWTIVGAACGSAVCLAVLVWALLPKGEPESQPTPRADEKRVKQREPVVGFVRSFTGHDKHVVRVAIAPGGQRMISVSLDKTARVWDLATGREELVFANHTDTLHFVAFSRDGKRAVTSSNDRTVRVWEVDTGREIKVLTGHDKRVWSAVFTPDGQRVFSGGDDATARLWDIATGTEIRAFTGHAKTINSVAVSPDGTRGLTGSWDGTMRIWDVATGSEVHRINAHGSRVSTVAFSPNGKYALSGGADKTVRLWDVATGQRLHQFDGHTEAVWIVAFSSDGQRILSGGVDQTLRLWNMSTKQLVHTFHGHTAGVTGAAFTPDGRFAVSSSADGTVRLWALPRPNKGLPPN